MAMARARTTVEWPSEKKKPDPSGRLPRLHQEPGGVVDGRDVVGIEGVAQPEAVGEATGTCVCRAVAAPVVGEQAPPGHVQQCDDTRRTRRGGSPRCG